MLLLYLGHEEVPQAERASLRLEAGQHRRNLFPPRPYSALDFVHLESKHGLSWDAVILHEVLQEGQSRSHGLTRHWRLKVVDVVGGTWEMLQF